MADWSFLTNPPRCCCASLTTRGVRLRDGAARTGVTERTAYAIGGDRTQAGYLVKHKDGRRYPGWRVAAPSPGQD